MNHLLFTISVPTRARKPEIIDREWERIKRRLERAATRSKDPERRAVVTPVVQHLS
jgi:hypothetical protein